MTGLNCLLCRILALSYFQRHHTPRITLPTTWVASKTCKSLKIAISLARPTITLNCLSRTTTSNFRAANFGHLSIISVAESQNVSGTGSCQNGTYSVLLFAVVTSLHCTETIFGFTVPHQLVILLAGSSACAAALW